MTTRAQLSRSIRFDGGYTTLMRAALEGRTTSVKLVLRDGVNVNARNADGRTALMYAAANSQMDSVIALLEYGADVNAAANDGCTALMLGAISGNSEIVRALLTKGADPSAQEVMSGKTALMLANARGYLDVAELLGQSRPVNNIS